MSTSSDEDFILAHRQEDVRRVALLASKRDDIDTRYVTEQIAGWQKARTKLPSWAAAEGIVYPPQLAMEQCSSEATARYKARIVERLLPQRDTLFDLTGGFGIDHAFLAPLFTHTLYIESQAQLCDLARHNFAILGLTHVEVKCADSTQLLPQLACASLIYADPARRGDHGQRTYAIADCTPDVCTLMPQLLKQSACVLLKFSPMLDWHQTVEQLNAAAGADVVREVHIVATGHECKELLVVLMPGEEGVAAPDLTVHCANDDDAVFVCRPYAEGDGQPPVVPPDEPLEWLWLYEPHAAIMKSGCFGAFSRQYGFCAVSVNSHLFVGSVRVEPFPGRRFRVEAVTTMNRRELRDTLRGIGRANITVRNFPMSVADLRRRLRLADGGDAYLFATTRADGTRVLLLCRQG